MISLYKKILLEMQQNEESFILITLFLSGLIDFGIIIPLWNTFHYLKPLIIQIIFLMLIFFTLYIIFKVYLLDKKVTNYIDKYIILYSIYLLAITFFKESYTHYYFILNPLTSFIASFSLSPTSLLNTFGNIFMYIPIGVYFRRKSRLDSKILILFFIIFIIIVEFLQGISRVGVCDTNDMLTNTFSFWLGFRIVKSKLYSSDLKIFVSNIFNSVKTKLLFFKRIFLRKH